MPRSELLETGLPDVAAYWSEYGSGGWIANRWLDGEAVWTMAGVIRGTYSVEENGRAPRRLLDPAGAGSFQPLPWYDSLRVVPGSGAAWQGFDGTFTRVEARTGGSRGAEGIVDVRNGDGGWDENSVMVSRQDTLSWLRFDTYGLNRGPAGTMDLGGRHLWDASGGVTRGRHTVELAFAEQGIADRLLGTEEESISGRVGSVTYRYLKDGGGAQVDLAQGRSRAESFSDIPEIPLSHREDTASEVSARAWIRSGWSAGAIWHQEDVSRTLSDAFEASARSYWGVVGWAGDVGGGRLTADFGAGKHDDLPKVNFAPAVHYEVRGRGFIARVGAERVLTAVWNELALGQLPFLQRSLVGVADVTLGGTRRRVIRGVVLAGTTTSRAVGSRTPLSEVVLRTGLAEDPETYTFALASVESRAEWRLHIGNAVGFANAQGFGLIRPSHSIQSNVDPPVGARAILGARWAMFTGDLGVQVYGGLDYVGDRESEFRDALLFGYTTSSAGVGFTLAGATITIRARNLENHSPEEPWLDRSTAFDTSQGTEALGPGREFRFALTLNLKN